MKAVARRILDKFLKDYEEAYGEGLDGLPEISMDRWRGINAVLNIYRSTLDEKMIEADIRRPQISLGELDSRTLRELCRPTVIDVEKQEAS